MDDAKLPDLSKLKGIKERLKKLPPQESASDTSNWMGRNLYFFRPKIDDKKGIADVMDRFNSLDEEKKAKVIAKVRERQEKQKSE
jgi:hypothetical protein